jgi:hypothetical protein
MQHWKEGTHVEAGWWQPPKHLHRPEVEHTTIHTAERMTVSLLWHRQSVNASSPLLMPDDEAQASP